MNNERTRRVGEQVKRTLGELIQRELRDPRVGWVTITAVNVTSDFSHATVYFTLFGEGSSVEDTLKALDHSAGFLRSRLSKSLQLRTVPLLHFKHDESVEHGSDMESLIDQVVAEDLSKHDSNHDLDQQEEQ